MQLVIIWNGVERRGCTLGVGDGDAIPTDVPANRNETISGVGTRGDGNCFPARYSFIPTKRSNALQSRFGTSSGAEIAFLRRDPTSPASGPLPPRALLRYDCAGTPRSVVKRTYKTIVSLRIVPTPEAQIDPKHHFYLCSNSPLAESSLQISHAVLYFRSVSSSSMSVPA